MSLRKFLVATIFLVCATAAPALGQGRQMRINFEVNGPFELKKANMVLPAGKYILFQISPTDRYLFALYREDLTHSPIALLRTTRVNYFVGSLPSETKLSMEINEASSLLYMILNGWDVPGDDGFEVITTSVKRPKKSGP